MVVTDEQTAVGAIRIEEVGEISLNLDQGTLLLDYLLMSRVRIHFLLFRGYSFTSSLGEYIYGFALWKSLDSKCSQSTLHPQG